MFCKYCGNKISDDALFCSKCGRRLAAEKTATPAESAPTEQTQPLPQSAANSKRAAVDSVQTETISETAAAAQSDSGASTATSGAGCSQTAQSDSDAAMAQGNAAQTEAATQKIAESATSESESAANAENVAISAKTESVATQTGQAQVKQNKPKRKSKIRGRIIAFTIIAAVLVVGISLLLFFDNPYNRVLAFGTAREQLAFAVEEKDRRLNQPYWYLTGSELVKLLEKALNKSSDSFDPLTRGDVLAELGDLYEHGASYGLEENTNTADYYYRQAIASWQQALSPNRLSPGLMYSASSNPLIRIGDLYVEHLHDSQTGYSYYEQAIEYYQQLADQGSESALEAIGNIYFDTLLDDQTGIFYYKQAADRGSVSAMVELGEMYLLGEHTWADYAEAAKYYQMVLDNADSSSSTYKLEATLRLADMYRLGTGVRQNYQTAFELYKRAAGDTPTAHGNFYAKFCIGVMYENGYGVSRDIATARAWYKSAAENGNEDAQAALDRLGR